MNKGAAIHVVQRLKERYDISVNVNWYFNNNWHDISRLEDFRYIREGYGVVKAFNTFILVAFRNLTIVTVFPVDNFSGNKEYLFLVYKHKVKMWDKSVNILLKRSKSEILKKIQFKYKNVTENELPELKNRIRSSDNKTFRLINQYLTWGK